MESVVNMTVVASRERRGREDEKKARRLKRRRCDRHHV
jgi:hypothetical protein